jgi:small subunit ribosomal protein S17
MAEKTIQQNSNAAVRNPKEMVGRVVSAKMQKTVVVAVDKVKVHPKYKKRFKVTKKYYAHSEEEFAVGDKVRIKEHKPVSKTKRWIVTEKLSATH